MKIFRAMFSPVSRSLLVAMAGALAWGAGAPAGAASPDTSVQAAVSGQAGAGGTQMQSSSAESLTGAPTERVTFSGKALIRAAVREDPDFRTPPIVVLSIDLSGVSGVGATSRKKYVTSDRTIIQRRLRPTDTVELTFPYWPSGTVANAEGPVGRISLSLTYDVGAQKLTAAAGSITSP